MLRQLWPQKQRFNFCQIVAQAAAFVKSKTYVAAGLKLYMSLAAGWEGGGQKEKVGRGLQAEAATVVVPTIVTAEAAHLIPARRNIPRTWEATHISVAFFVVL